MPLHWTRVENYAAMSEAGASRIAAAIEARLSQGRPMLLGLATGNTMLVLYQRLAELLNQRSLILSQLHTFNLDEYVGADGRWVPPDHPLSYHAYMEKNLFSRLDPGLGMDRRQIHFPDPQRPAAVDELIRAMGGLDLQLLGIGFNGHIAFNEPMSEAEISAPAFAALPTRVIDLTELTIETNARLTAGGDRSRVPRQAVTLGMAPILAAREVLLLACFPEQQSPLRKIRQAQAKKGDSPRPTFGRCPPERPEACCAQMGTVPFFPPGPTPELPASYLLDHPQATVLYTGDVICLEEEG